MLKKTGLIFLLIFILSFNHNEAGELKASPQKPESNGFLKGNVMFTSLNFQYDIKIPHLRGNFKNFSLITQDTLRYENKSPIGAMLRSALIPGWGQLYNRKILKSMLFFSVEAYLLFQFFEKDRAAQSEEEIDRYNQLIDERNLYGWWFVGVHFLCIGDAYVDAHLYKFDESTDLSGKLKFDSANIEVLFKFSLNF